ncbi:hypothetical protein ACFO4N_06275 [Camelliibacillus cellulosilyticus]|uniref:Uncharacterized protein n=1 Tax=Camelliibacillus cellulosilyticus TaxID=2174486 RepID=A0ABV9GM09_9BACL
MKTANGGLDGRFHVQTEGKTANGILPVSAINFPSFLGQRFSVFRHNHSSKGCGLRE